VATARSGHQVFGLQGPCTKELPSEYMRRTCRHLHINPGELRTFYGMLQLVICASMLLVEP
jgi:hypothetical protein